MNVRLAMIAARAVRAGSQRSRGDLSGARERPVHGLGQVGVREVQVPRRGGDVRVAEQTLDYVDVDPLAVVYGHRFVPASGLRNAWAELMDGILRTHAIFRRRSRAS
jgi:hypothetical protein